MNDQRDTIFALATTQGKSGVAILRISGSKAGDILFTLGIATTPEPRLAKLCTLRSPYNGEIIDRCLVIFFPAPASFTGEDVVELHIHGSRAIIRELISVLGKIDGLRIAEAGEFSRRAFLNQKMNLTELEGLADLIDSETSMQKRQAMRQITGELHNLYEQWRKDILSVLAQVEAYIDFPDEDLPDNLNKEFNKKISALVSSLDEHLNDRSGIIIRDGFHAVILGAPNVGKSSLLNALAKRDVAIVSDIAGTTRDIIEVHLDLDGHALTITDTAGIRESKESIEEEGIRRALKRAEVADLKIVMFDATSSSLDKKSLKLVDKNTIVALNKTDLKKPSAEHRTPNTEHFKNALCVIPLSIKKKTGLDSLLNEISAFLSEKFSPSSSPVFTRERHRISLQKSKELLDQFLVGRKKKIAIELSAEELRMAAREIGKITGRIDVEEILGEIFSSFCIGK